MSFQIRARSLSALLLPAVLALSAGAFLESLTCARENEA